MPREQLLLSTQYSLLTHFTTHYSLLTTHYVTTSLRHCALLTTRQLRQQLYRGGCSQYESLGGRELWYVWRLWLI